MNDDTLKNYEFWAAKGIGAVPLYDRKKEPAISKEYSFLDNPAPPELRREWAEKYRNIGVICGNSLVVWDFEEFGLPVKLLPKWEEEKKKYYVVKTGKGFHLYFWHTGYPIPYAKFMDGKKSVLEIRTGKHHVAGAGSIHPSGALYEKIGGDEPTELSKEDYEKLLQRCNELGWKKGKAKQFERENAQDIEITRLEKIPDEILALVAEGCPKGGGRNNVRFVLALKLAGCGLSQDEVLKKISIFNSACEEPDTSEKIKQHVAQIFTGIRRGEYHPIVPRLGRTKKDTQITSADILLNPIRQTDRFGAGMKNNMPYFGVPVANLGGEIIPAIVFDGKLIFGKENLESAGFNINPDFVLAAPETWQRERLFNFLKNPRNAKSTKELLEKLVELNKRFVAHQDERAHSVIAAYIMMTFIFFAFRQIPRMVFVGLPNSGKSVQTDFIIKLSLNPISSADASKSAVFRTLEVLAGLVAIDNFDNLGEEEKFVFGQLYDTSYEEGRAVLRVEDSNGKKTPKAFRTLCPMVVNSVDLTWMKASSRTRTILIRMIINSNKPLEKLNSIADSEIEDLKDELRIWGLENCKRLGEIEVPSSFANRQRDIARPILSILQDAGEDYQKEGSEYLANQFQEFQEDESGYIGEHLLAIWGLVMEKTDNGHQEAALTAGEVAEAVLFGRGFNSEIWNWTTLRQKEATIAGHVLTASPFSRKTRPLNKATYHFQPAKLASFLKSRGYEIGEDGEELLKNTLTYPNNPNNTNIPSLTLTNPNIPIPQKEEEHIMKTQKLGYDRVCEGQNGASPTLTPQKNAKTHGNLLEIIKASGMVGILASSLTQEGVDENAKDALEQLTAKRLVRFENGKYYACSTPPRPEATGNTHLPAGGDKGPSK